MFSFGRGGQARGAFASSALRSKPKVGLALSAGAARGWSRLGVLRELMGRGFDPDIVVGTSIDAVVGGCSCAGGSTRSKPSRSPLTSAASSG